MPGAPYPVRQALRADAGLYGGINADIEVVQTKISGKPPYSIQQKVTRANPGAASVVLRSARKTRFRSATRFQVRLFDAAVHRRGGIGTYVLPSNPLQSILRPELALPELGSATVLTSLTAASPR